MSRYLFPFFLLTITFLLLNDRNAAVKSGEIAFLKGLAVADFQINQRCDKGLFGIVLFNEDNLIARKLPQHRCTVSHENHVGIITVGISKQRYDGIGQHWMNVGIGFIDEDGFAIL